jgi:hypothetical protein
MTERVIGRRRFTDGEVRIVFEDAAGQCVLDDDGDLVRGVWIVPSEQEADTPLLVSRQDQPRKMECTEATQLLGNVRYVRSCPMAPPLA